MSGFVDFDEIKKTVSLAQAADMLGLQMKKTSNQMRGPCPVCKGGERGLVITDGKGAYCFSTQKGGDVIWLASHVRGCTAKEAAAFLAGDNPKTTVPQKEDGGQVEEKGFTPLSYLEHDHAAIVALGFDVEFCKAHGIGYAGKGILRGTIAVPFRSADGTLLGYIGVEDCKLPPSFTSNVVPLKRA